MNTSPTAGSRRRSRAWIGWAAAGCSVLLLLGIGALVVLVVGLFRSYTF